MEDGMTRVPKAAMTVAISMSMIASLSLANSNRTDFESSSTVDETRRQIEALPTDDIWWTVNGKDMAWNFKNLQRFLPTVSGQRIISERLVKLIRDGGNPALLKNARYPGWRDDSVKHNVYQWDLVYTNNDFYKGGWGGQGLLVNPDRDIVAVWTGYFKDDEHSEVEPLPVLRAVINGVYGDD
jgi:CubicO group peptidase (beta-lactamase class C family)